MTAFIYLLSLSADKTKKEEKGYSMPLFGFQLVVYFYSLYSIYYTAIWGNECVSLPKHGSVLDPIPSFFI
jgi:hypothetical protein